MQFSVMPRTFWLRFLIVLHSQILLCSQRWFHVIWRWVFSREIWCVLPALKRGEDCRSHAATQSGRLVRMLRLELSVGPLRDWTMDDDISCIFLGWSRIAPSELYQCMALSWQDWGFPFWQTFWLSFFSEGFQANISANKWHLASPTSSIRNHKHYKTDLKIPPFHEK